MISDAGTKEPRSEADLVELTGLDSWQVKATLANLARLGLVRRLEIATTVWEIAHDFLARIIGQLIGRLKPKVYQRARPLIAPIVLLGWVALAVLALPYWTIAQKQASERALQQLHASLAQAGSGGLAVTFSNIGDDNLALAGPHLERVNPAELQLSSNFITSLEPLKGLTNLSSLSLFAADGITSLEPLQGLTNLNRKRRDFPSFETSTYKPRSTRARFPHLTASRDLTVNTRCASFRKNLFPNCSEEVRFPQPR